MKAFFAASLFLLSVQLMSQKNVTSSSFLISGEVKSGRTFSEADLLKFTSHEIGDVVITNHMGEKKGDSKKMTGVLLKDVLGTVEIQADSPKELSGYYFICKANDGYTVVYSWNEIFNTAVGETAYLVTSKEGKAISEMEGAILMISSKDYKTGRRQLKALTSIEVRRAK